MNPQDRTLRASLAAHSSWANTLDPTSRTAKARAAANGGFERQARELHPDATDDQIARVAGHLRSAHFKRLALASAKARRAKKTAAAKPRSRRSHRQAAAMPTRAERCVPLPGQAAV